MTHFRLARMTVITLLLVGSVTLTGIAHRAARDTAESALPRAAELPWAALDPGLQPPTANRTPIAILYVQRRCLHCTPTASALDAQAAVAGVHATIIALDPAAETARWADSLGLTIPVARDTGRAWMTALSITGVPTMLTYDRNGRATITVGSLPPGAMRRRLESLR
jgi:hypothetical protein